MEFDFAAPATLVCTRVECALAPTDAALHLRGDQRPFALVGAWAGGGALLGSEPVAVVQDADEVLAALDRQPQLAEPRHPAGAVGGGWVGYLGFQLGRQAERLDPAPPPAIALPTGALAFYDHVLREDAEGHWWFEALVTPARESLIRARRDELAARLRRAVGRRPFTARDWRWSPGPAGHAQAVEACRERIRAGDLFQANLAMRLEGQLDGEPLDLFAAAACALPTDRAAFLGGPWGAVASLSPEMFLVRRGRDVRTAPIKGTRPAGRADELRDSVKDRAENVMIVDLMRNDLGRVCIPGSIHVPALAQLRPHAGVWHLVSEVAGRLRDAVSDADLLRATFPPGSVTGAPKIAALNVISELESTRREAYTGAIGFASPVGGLELSVTIRTFEFCGSRVWLGAGGGIVADSRGGDEATEAAAKASPLLAAIGATPPPLALTPPHPGIPRFARHGPRPVPRPDPGVGVFETVRIVDGVARRWPAHRARLAGSLAALYGASLPEDLDARVEDAARELAAHGVADARLRVDVIPGQAPELTTSPNRAPAPAILRPVRLAGGLGEHKWRDRRLLEAHEDDDPTTLPLLVDADGYVLETSRTGIVARATDGSLWTPPADGRILPSVTVAAGGARPRRLTLEDLRAASAIYVASALRELQPAELALRTADLTAVR